jgi:hypothetical protein
MEISSVVDQECLPIIFHDDLPIGWLRGKLNDGFLVKKVRQHLSH